MMLMNVLLMVGLGLVAGIPVQLQTIQVSVLLDQGFFDSLTQLMFSLLKSEFITIKLDSIQHFVDLPAIGPIHLENVTIRRFEMRDIQVFPQTDRVWFHMEPEFNLDGSMVLPRFRDTRLAFEVKGELGVEGYIAYDQHKKKLIVDEYPPFAPDFKVTIKKSSALNVALPRIINLCNAALQYIMSRVVGKFLAYKIAVILPKLLTIMFEDLTSIRGNGWDAKFSLINVTSTEEGVRITAEMQSSKKLIMSHPTVITAEDLGWGEQDCEIW